ncbi:MAG: acetyl-CoA decarbonylase/synthase complex subunit gamma [Elusimicrobia bacterium]|nr:acetyl-CoA decarbonylase/synthase complex subunit gamma [Candidatus Liberimonas magnetica]
MALTGLQIFKLLPNKNCNECGVPTCLAFAMKLAAKAAEPKSCPYISEEAMGVLGASQTPPIKKLSFRLSGKSIDIGAETVMYRHEKRFINKPVIALEISDGLSNDEFDKKLKEIMSYTFNRVGEDLFCEGISLLNTSNNIENYINRYKALTGLDRVIILSGINPAILEQVLNTGGTHANLILNSCRLADFDGYVNIASGKDIKVVVEAENPEELFDLVLKAEGSSIKNIILKQNSNSVADLLKNNVTLRRLALKRNFKPAGYPILSESSDRLFDCVTGICKYSSIIILKDYNGASLFPLLTLRQNIYTDPQKPLQIQPGIYKVGEPAADSPLMVTTNFSLTYFIVSGEVGNSPYSAWLLIADSEGMSVLTAWSANKFSPELIARSVRDSKIENEIKHRKIIIPGYVAILQGDLEEKLAGWEVKVGPQEAVDIPQYLKETWKQ